MATPNIEDVLFAVQRNNELKNCKGSDLKDNLQDGDLLAVTRGDVTYKLEVEGPMPWEGFNGGVFHIKDVVEVGTGSQGTIRFNTTCQAWTISGNDLGLIDEYSGTDEIVIATSDTEYLFKGNSGNDGINWNFGEETDTSEVTTMFGMFYNCRKFNGQLGGNWDTSNVESMLLMFFNAREFNQPVGDWVTSKVTNMEAAFYSARGFNQPIGDWDTSSVENMNSMLANTHAFNQYIGDWDTSNVTDMSEMISGCTVFDQDIGNWDVSNVVDMYNMASSCTEFNQDLSNWCVTNITTEPTDFDLDATAWTKPRPCWGHCPPKGDPCPPEIEIDTGLDPDGNPLIDSILFVFECLTDDVQFYANADSWNTDNMLDYWYNDVKYEGYPQGSSTPSFSDRNPKTGDIFKVKLEPKHFAKLPSYDIRSNCWCPLQLTGGKIKILPETDITYLTDSSVLEFSKDYPGNSNQPITLIASTAPGGDFLNDRIQGIQNVRLGPNLANTNEWFYVLYVRDSTYTTYDLRGCRNPHAPEIEPTWQPRFNMGGSYPETHSEETYGLIVNHGYSDNNTFIIDDWDTYRGV